MRSCLWTRPARPAYTVETEKFLSEAKLALMAQQWKKRIARIGLAAQFTLLQTDLYFGYRERCMTGFMFTE